VVKKTFGSAVLPYPVVIFLWRDFDMALPVVHGARTVQGTVEGTSTSSCSLRCAHSKHDASVLSFLSVPKRCLLLKLTQQVVPLRGGGRCMALILTSLASRLQVYDLPSLYVRSQKNCCYSVAPVGNVSICTALHTNEWSLAPECVGGDVFEGDHH